MEKIKTTNELIDFIITEFAESRNTHAKDNTYCRSVGYKDGEISSGAKYDQTNYLIEVLNRIKKERI